MAVQPVDDGLSAVVDPSKHSQVAAGRCSQSSQAFGPFMASTEVSAVISDAFGRLNGAIHSRDGCQSVQMVAAEEVLQWSGISQSARSYRRAYVLSEQAC